MENARFFAIHGLPCGVGGVLARPLGKDLCMLNIPVSGDSTTTKIGGQVVDSADKILSGEGEIGG